MTTAAAKRYMGRVAALGCCLCRWLGLGWQAAEVHHPRVDLYGGAMKCSDFDTIGLCPRHHRGKNGVHDLGHDEFTQFWGISERELQRRVKQQLGGGDS